MLPSGPVPAKMLPPPPPTACEGLACADEKVTACGEGHGDDARAPRERASGESDEVNRPRGVDTEAAVTLPRGDLNECVPSVTLLASNPNPIAGPRRPTRTERSSSCVSMSSHSSPYDSSSSCARLRGRSL